MHLESKPEIKLQFSMRFKICDVHDIDTNMMLYQLSYDATHLEQDQLW